MKSAGFDREFEAFLNYLRRADETSFIQLDKEKELAYLQSAKYRFKSTFQAIPSGEQIKVLDIGTTPFTLFIKECCSNHFVATLDLTNNLEERCIAKGIHFKVCDLERESIPFEDDFFDIVIFTEVLEHLFAPPRLIMGEIKRVMRPGGKLIISVPNLARLANRLKLLFGVSPLSNPEDQMKRGWVHGHGHVREYTAKEVASILRASGFTVSKKRFLEPGLVDAVRGPSSKGIFKVALGVYRLVTLVIPSFRGTFVMECYKAGTEFPAGKVT